MDISADQPAEYLETYDRVMAGFEESNITCIGEAAFWCHGSRNQLTEPEYLLATQAEPTSAEDPLIILYTSGTTGKPKGIAHTHASFPIKAAQDMAFGTDVGRGTRISWYTDIGWMMGPWLIYGALINGATICIYDGAPDYPTPDRMWEFCAKHKVEVLGISPTLVRALAAHEDKTGSPPCLGGVDAASADGVVVKKESDSVFNTTPPRKASAPLLNKEGSPWQLNLAVAYSPYKHPLPISPQILH